jgi:hypothetical protein
MNKELFSKIFIFASIGILSIFLFKAISNQKEIEKNGGETICKLTLCEQRGKNSASFVKYYINGIKYRTYAGGCPDGFESKINSYFSMKYDKKNPNNIVVDFNSKIIDSTLIKELEKKIKFSMFE